MKKKRVILNLLSSIISKLITVCIGIIVPKLYLEHFGSEMNGLASSISGIFVYINLLEAGVGGASIQALYKYTSQKNEDKINEILSATNIYYKKSGIYFLGCVSLLAFAYPIFIESNIKYFTIVAIILLSSIPSAMMFFFQGKYTVLLNADNRAYILTIFNTVFNTISNIVKIVLMINGFNVIIVQAGFSMISMLQILITYLYVKKKYSYLNFDVNPDYGSISQKNSVIIHQIASTIFNNIDVLLLTIFCDLKVVSVYTIYTMIFSNASYIPTIFYSSLTASFGQLYGEDKERFKKVFNLFETYYMMIVFIVFITAYILTTPFLKIYTANIADINYIDYWLPILFLSVNLLSNARWPAVILINIAGHFRETQWRALVEMTINLILSIVLVNICGIYGVLIATIIALFYRTIDMIIYSSKYLLNRSCIKTIKILVFYTIIGLLQITVYDYFNIEIYNYIEFFVVALLLISIITLVYFIATLIIEKDIRMNVYKIIKNKFNKRENCTGGEKWAN